MPPFTRCFRVQGLHKVPAISVCEQRWKGLSPLPIQLPPEVRAASNVSCNPAGGLLSQKSRPSAEEVYVVGRLVGDMSNRQNVSGPDRFISFH